MIVRKQFQIYYDITDVLEYARYNATLSGIQRFSIELLALIIKKQQNTRIKVIAFHPVLKRVVVASVDYFAIGSYDQEDFCRAFSMTPRTIIPKTLDRYIAAKYNSRSRRHFHKLRLLA